MPTKVPPPDIIKSTIREARYITLGEVGFDLAKDSPTIFRSEIFYISGKHDSPNQNVYIIANRVIATDATIDVSGDNGIPSFLKSDHAANGVSPGFAGLDADKSDLKPGLGHNAGNVTIVCRTFQGTLTIVANGGIGGNGLNGGTGAKGATGPNGQDEVDEDHKDLANAGNGLQGGKAGDGGTPGNGGNAGLIYIAIQQKFGTLNLQSVPGNPGTPGDPGQRGQPGDPGQPGAWGYTWSEPGNSEVFHQTGSGRTGIPGAWGLPGNTGNIGLSGKTEEAIQINDFDFAGLADEAWLIELLRQAEDDYATENLSASQSTLEFINQIAADQRMATDTPILLDNGINLLWTRGSTLLAQMAQGLSYFGQTRDSVTRRNPTKLQPTLQQLTDYALIITNRLEKISDIVAVADQRYTELSNSADLAKEQRSKIDLEIDSLTQNYNDLNTKLPDLEQMVIISSTELNKAQTAFQLAIANSVPGCNFVDFVKVVASIVAIAWGAYEAIPALASVGQKLAEDGITVNNLSVISKSLEPVEDDFDKISTAYDKIKGYLDKNSIGAMITVTPNLLELRLNDTLTKIDSVQGVSDTDKETFKNVIQHFVDTVQARNSAILQLDNLVAKLVTLYVQSKNLLQNENHLRDAAQTAAKPDLKTLSIALASIKRSLKWFNLTGHF